MDQNKILQDYFKASSGLLSEEDFQSLHGVSTEDFENTFVEETNTDIAGAESLKDISKQKNFNVGGLVDDGTSVDGESGNKVPAGSMDQEVRDDLTIGVSEGEYVIPANVVRFFGVDYFEKLIGRAEKGLQSMEENGRIGGQEYNEGGLVESSFDPNQWKTLGANLNPSFESAPTDFNTEYKLYTNAQGMSMMVLYVNGVPAQPIPEGYTEGEQTLTDKAVEQPTVKRRERRDRSSREERVSPLLELDFENPDSITEWARDSLNKSNPVFDLLKTVNPTAGSVLGLADQVGRISQVRAAALAAGEAGNTSLQMQLDTEADQAAERSSRLRTIPRDLMSGQRIYEQYLSQRTTAPTKDTNSPAPNKVRKNPKRKGVTYGGKKDEGNSTQAYVDIVEGKTNYAKGGFVVRRK